EGELGHPGALQRQGEKDQAFLDVAGDVEGLRGIGLDRDVERRAVRKHPFGGGEAHLADLEELLVDLQPGETGTVGNERLEPLAHQTLEIALRLLALTRPKEQSFRPNDAVVLRHVGAIFRTSLQNMDASAETSPPGSWKDGSTGLNPF